MTLAVYGLSTGGHLYGRDGAAMAEMTSSLLERGRLDVSPGVNTQGGRFGRDGRYYTPFGIGQSLAAAPLLAFGRLLGSIGSLHYIPYSVLAFFGSLVGAGVAALLTRLCLQAGFAPAPSVAAGLGYALGTLAWPTSATFYSETLTTFLLLGGLLGGLTAVRTGRAGPALLGGGLLAWMIQTRVLAAVLIPGLALALLDRKGANRQAGRVLIWWLVPAVLGLMLYGGLGWYRFGSPFETAYQLEPDGRPRSFTTPLGQGLRILLLSPGKSVLIFAPGLVAALAGLWSLRRKRPALAAGLTGAGLAILMTIAQWSAPEGGYCWGPRLLLPGIAPLFLGLAAFLEAGPRRRLRWGVVLLLLGLGVGVQLAGTTVSFVEVIDADPFLYYRVDYRPSFNPFPEHLRRTVAYLLRDLPPGRVPVPAARVTGDLILANWVGELDVWWVHLAREGVPAVALWLPAGLLLLAGAVGLRLLVKGSRQERLACGG